MSASTYKALLGLALIVFAGCARPPRAAEPAESPLPPETSARRLVVGDIDANDPVRKFEWLKPFADHLASRLTRFGIGGGDVKIASDTETMVSWLRAGEVDIYLDSLYPAVIVCERSAAVPLLRRWKGGVSEYHTVFLTMPGSGIRTLEELPGHLLALDDEASTSGFFVPISHLRSQGFELVLYNSPRAVPDADQIGYIFTGDDENSVQWLLSGRVAAIAIDNITFSRDIEAATRDRLVVLAETEPVPRQVLVARSDLDPALQAELLELLLRLHETPAGRVVLESIDTARFDHFPEGPLAALKQMESAYLAQREWLGH